ncbi:MAG: hypothetical protein FGM57_03270 [Candidatus Taylorbacteria bacterium]|nr:hypothetical protein [Candidatus Taylorbacteria bacterium]
MSRKATFLVILIVISLFVGGLTGFYFYSKNKNPEPSILGRNTSNRTFGGYNPDDANISDNRNNDPLIVPETPGEKEKVKKLRKISSEPVAGADFISIPLYATSTTNIEPEDTSRTNGRIIRPTQPKLVGYLDTIRFMERATGHIYETSTSSLEKTRISNTTIPKIYEALFTENGKSLILRDLVGGTDIIRTRYAISALATTTDSEQSLVLTDLTPGITQITVSPTKDRTFSILSEGVTGFLSKIDGGSKQTLLDIPFREWLVSWPEAKTIVVNTKPSGFYPGFAYAINPDNRSFTRIIGGINGLTTLMSPDTTKVLYSESSSGSFRMGVLDRKTNERRDITLRTFPEKCVWANTEKDVVYCAVPEDVAFNTYPDVWYQGRIGFSDSIWKINITSGETRLLSKIQDEAGEIVDVQSISINKNDDYLLFTNKNNLQLWGLMLKEPAREVFDPLKDRPATTTDEQI